MSKVFGLPFYILGAGGPASDPLLAALPEGAIGVWVMDEYASDAHPVVANLLSAQPVSANLFGLSRRQFNNTGFWTKSGSTIVDEAVPDPAGATQASTLAGTGGWSMQSTSNANLPAGTYTAAMNAKRNIGSDQVFAFTSDNTATRSSVKTAGAAWARFTYTFTLDDPAAINRIGLCSSDGSTAADLQIVDFELYAGSVDLGPQVLAGHLYLGRTAVDSLPTFLSGALDFSSAKLGFMQFPDVLSIQDATISAVVRKKVTGAGSNFHASLSRINNYQNLTAAMEISNKPAFSNASAFTGGMANLWELFGQGWHIITHRQRSSDNRRDLFIDTCKLAGFTSAPALVDCKDLAVSFVNSITLTSNYEIAAILLWDRALTDSEIRA